MTIQCLTCMTDNPAGSVLCFACGDTLAIEDSSQAATASPLHLASGTVLNQGKYQIDKTLGQGGFGITYKATQRATGAAIAIKEFFPLQSARQGTVMFWSMSVAPAEQRQELEKFKAEAENLSKCLHPNIARVYDWFEENNTAYIVMEYVAGQPLSQILEQEGSLSEARIQRYLQQLADALKVVHTNQLLHRDIKPENIILNASDQVVLIDFGNARAFQTDLTHKLTNVGTAAYAPLEQNSSKGRFAPSLDIYSLCASMYELLTGELPPSAMERAVSDTLKSPRQLVPSISPLLEQTILTGLKLRAEERFQSADELLDALSGKLISPLLRKAREFVRQNKLSEAVQAYEKCLKNEPDNGVAAIEQALVSIHVVPTQAGTIAQKAIQLQPNDSRGHGVLGLLECRKTNWAIAVQHLQRATQLAPQEAWIQTNLAWALAKTGHWQEAEASIAQALQLNNDSAFAQGLQAWIAVNQYQYKPAIRAARQAIFKAKQQQMPDLEGLLEWVYPCLVMGLEQAVVTQQATDVDRCLQEYITQLPNSGFAPSFKGWKYGVQGHWQEAIVCLEQASQKSSVPSWVLVNLAIAQEKLHQPQAAIQTYERQIQKFPQDVSTLLRLGTVLGNQGQWERAKAYFNKVVQIQPNSGEAFHNLGWVLLNLKKQNEQSVNSREILAMYRKAFELYSQQNKNTLAQQIKSAFRAESIEF